MVDDCVVAACATDWLDHVASVVKLYRLERPTAHPEHRLRLLPLRPANRGVQIRLNFFRHSARDFFHWGLPSTCENCSRTRAAALKFWKIQS